MTTPRPAERIRKRVPCDIRLRDARRSGMVLNLSRSGLFVQTTVAAKPGEDVELLLNAPQTRIAIPVNAQIVWNRVVNPQFRSVVQGGFGARIRAASDDYYELLRDYAPFD
ncbi:MAG: PilZ domain-containing protein [Myxococcales bacterium]|nr:PilZ domain-containing protein [Myxococcales bacterium]